MRFSDEGRYKRCQERGVARDVGARRMIHVAAPTAQVYAGEGGISKVLVRQRGRMQET
jgi:hypothetical protein